MNNNLTTNASNEAESPAFLVGAVMCCAFLDWVNLHTHFWKSVHSEYWYDKSEYYGKKGFTTMEVYELFVAQHSTKLSDTRYKTSSMHNILQWRLKNKMSIENENGNLAKPMLVAGAVKETKMNLVAELEKKITTEMENKYFPKFEKQAAYLGNGVYSIPATNIYSTDTRELFLMFVAAQENISFKQR